MSSSFHFAIPYHDRPGFLKEAIGSVLHQSEPEWVLTICDNSDDPKTAEACVREFKDPRVHYLRNPAPAGMAENWNLCLDTAESGWVTVLHADDRLRAGYLTEMKSFAAKHPDATALFCGAATIDEIGDEIFSATDRFKGLIIPRHGQEIVLQGEPAITALLRGNFIFCPTIAYNAAKLGSLRFDSRYRMLPDLDMTLKILRQGGTIAGIPDRKLYEYRRHQTNASLSSTRDMTRFQEELGFYSRMKDELSAAGLPAAARVASRATIIWLYLAYSIVRDFARGRVRGPAKRLTFAVRAWTSRFLT